MGEYVLDFTKDTIIVDGHICDRTEYDGIYKVRGEYLENWQDWCYSEANKNLAMICLITDNINEEKSKIEYICKHDNLSLDEMTFKLKKVNRSYMKATCIHYDTSFMFIGGMWI